MLNTLLYPIDSLSRRSVSLNGIWGFQLDPKSTGENDGWTKKLPAPDSIPVPASFADFYTDKNIREYCGDFWYEKDVFVPAEWQGMTVAVRFGCATHVATVWCNGKELVSHEGGFLPFSADISDFAVYGGMNHIAVKVNNELSETRMPCGQTKVRPDVSKRAAPYFDFYNYSGLQRNVWLIALPKIRIEDYALVHPSRVPTLRSPIRSRAAAKRRSALSSMTPKASVLPRPKAQKGRCMSKAPISGRYARLISTQSSFV